MSIFIRTIACSIVTAGALLMADRPLQAGIIYDAAADFSPTNNPNGVWSYGYSTTLNSAFQLYTQSGPNNENNPPANLLDTWNAGTGGQFVYPSVLHNGTANTISSDGFTYLPGQLGLHPGSAGQYSIVRFTVPTAGAYSIASSFYAIDPHLGALLGHVDVHVLRNDVAIFSDAVDGPVDSASFNTVLMLSTGDVLDFKVGYGSNQDYNSDSTGVDIVVERLSEVPEPASLTLFGLGALGMGFMTRRVTG